jgi:ribose/xylose/arabinose/galactoside ABC-type transport system permease subunit
LATGSVAAIPIPVIVMAVVFALFFFLLRFTFFGRDVYAIGGNEDAAALPVSASGA